MVIAWSGAEASATSCRGNLESGCLGWRMLRTLKQGLAAVVCVEWEFCIT